jgi:hypothetical protein
MKPTIASELEKILGAHPIAQTLYALVAWGLLTILLWLKAMLPHGRLIVLALVIVGLTWALKTWNPEKVQSADANPSDLNGPEQ